MGGLALTASTRLQGLRSADVVMAPWRAAAASPTPLSFSRSLVRKMVAERWRITRIVFELDDEGRGEALYRVEAPQIAYHFVVVSDVFPPDQKIDRAFGINWDVSAALCEGKWTDERRALLVEEVPKQYDGRYPADVLCFCRGNRSERIFDHVVDALASGAQPDAALLASVGYLLRSTAFAGNGLFGMKPFEAFDRTHPLGATYHAQILAAYLLRIFVSDLVEHIAGARSAAAARLDPAIKRYLGVGNSAGLGLVPFIMNHPRIIHQWCFAQESAFAEALDRLAEPDAIAAFGTMLDKARIYFRQDQRDGNGIFAEYARLAAEFDAMRAALDRIDAKALTHWRVVCDSILPPRHHPETAEALLGLLLELFPEIVARWDARLVSDESTDVDPAMTVEQLAVLVRASYGWLLDKDAGRTCSHFWYYPLESPYEPRRGLRGTGTSFETETPMDLPRLLPRLLAALAAAPDEMPVGVFLARNSHFAPLAQRVQSLVGLDYAELRVDSLAPDYLPFAACRFLLAFYGMEKYDPRLPRSTKGALLQGAPLPDEIAHGIEGDWPFPLTPEAGGAETPVIVPQRLVEQPEIAIDTLKPLGRRAPTRDHAEVTVFPAEMRKLLTRAAFGAGLDAAAADAAIRLALVVGEAWIDGTLATLETRISARLRCDGNTIEGAGLPDFAIAPAVLDLAGGLAHSGVGQALGAAGASTSLLGGVALWGAARGFLTVVANAAAGTLTMAGGTEGAVWCGVCEDMCADRAAGTSLAPVAQALTSLSPTWSDAGAPALSRRFAVFCIRQPISWKEAEPALAALGAVEIRAPGRVAEIRRRSIVEGFRLSPQQFQQLSRLAKRGLAPPEIETVLTGQASAAA
jgi:hypothetical protein